MTEADSEYYEAVKARLDRDISIYPDQKEIDVVKLKILEVIKINPGVLQTDLRKLFSSEKANVYGLAYSAIMKEGRVLREKAGRTFRIYTNEK